MNKKVLFLLPLALIFLAAFVQAASVTVSTFYDATPGTSLTVMNGDSVGVIVSADSIFEGYMDVKLELINSASVATSLVDVHTIADSYYNHITIPASSLPVGTYTIRGTVTGASGSTDTSTLSLVVQAVTPTNHAPVIISTPVTSVNEGAAYAYDVDATDAEGDTIVYSLTQNPSWLSINSATGLISGTAPSVTSDYDYIVTVKASDGKDFDTQTFTITVRNIVSPPTNTAPTITSSPVLTVNECAAYSYDVNANDAEGNTLIYSITSNPGWISINSATGLVTGTAPSVNSNTAYSVGVTVSDGALSATQSYTINVLNSGTCPVVPTNTAPVANNQNVVTNMNTALGITVTATDVDGDTLVYAIVSNPMHGTISGFNTATGTLTYTPHTGYVGSDSFTFRANDGTVNSNVATVSITVNPIIVGNTVPVITSTPVLTVNEGTVYSYDVDATDADGNTLTYSLTTSPAWLSINSATGLITGTAPLVSANTPFTIVVSVSDGAGGIVTQTYTLIVLDIVLPPTNTAPTVTSSPVLNVNECAAYSYDFDATDAEGNTLVYSLTTNPGWISINSVTGLITGTAPSVSANTAQSVVISVFDGTVSATQSYNINVLNSGTCPPGTNNLPTITSSPVLTVNEGAAYSYDVDATDADGNTLTYSLTTSPAWLSINSVTGLISGTAPMVSADTGFTIVVSVSDGVGGIITQTYTLIVRDTSGGGSGGSGGGVSRIRVLSDPYYEEQYSAQFGRVSPIVLEEDEAVVKKVFSFWEKLLFWLFILILLLIILLVILMITRN